MVDELDSALDVLEEILLAMGSVVVGFSGGIDSTYLGVFANKVLGPENVLVVTADSPSLARSEFEEAKSLALELGLSFEAVLTREFEMAEYLVNDELRCYYCKSALMDRLGPIAKSRDAVVILGVNASDEGDYRPGQIGAREAGARFPLLEARMSKEMIRQHALALGIPIHDKPASACLSSRVPYGTAITIAVLSRVERAERELRLRGYRQVRVRDFDETARIEVEIEMMPQLIQEADEVVRALKKLGYLYVTLSLEGFVSGNLNRAIGR
ncbi:MULTISPECIES: ATP-dependent sacrificial sulfur transferase LarE [Acidithrix]|uniref:NH(3)-dependent NAD(+) synthetase n=1 Tax=Acidithrix ferrooxidans TaxID=1280514 RepID=A0A0D8HJT1_9ACTN|nr:MULTISPECIES: ATP-dependent sacrificial sulfur transferase LarE [Acidithrix]KJF17992.1 NH(3)-dependent NAD(+) synthetase [Acidithrix ferrooxidans]